MAKKKKPTERPTGTGLAAFREYQQKLVNKDVESELNSKSPEDIVSSGSILIDKIVGNGGFVRGAIVEVAGQEHSGKSTLCLQTARVIQQNGGSVAYINSEQSMDESYARSLGVDIDDKSKWFYTNENTYEGLAPIINGLITVGQVDAIIIDSATAIFEKASLEDDTINKSTQIGVAARFWSEYTPKLIRLANENNVLILMTNQIRVTGISHTGVTKDTTGGAALKYYKTLGIHLQGRKPQSDKITDDFGNDVYGFKDNSTQVFAKVEKNKWGPAFTAASGRIVPYKGFDNIYSLFQLAVQSGVIKVSGSWISYGSEGEGFKVQGREQALAFIEKSPELLKKLVSEVGLNGAENYFNGL